MHVKGHGIDRRSPNVVMVVRHGLVGCCDRVFDPV